VDGSAERPELAAVLDVPRVLDMRRGHPEVMDAVVTMYLRAAATLIENLIGAVDRGDVAGIVRDANRLRDVSESIGAAAVADISGDLQLNPRRVELVFDLRERMSVTRDALLSICDA
jgi:HPt (histidine-containing phosphotransfer) domain-containing protein